MVVEARLRVRPRRVQGETPATGRVLHVTGDSRHCLTVLEADTPEALERLLAEKGGAPAPEDVVEASGRSLVYRCACEPEGVARTAERLGVSVAWPLVELAGVMHCTVLAPTRARLQALVKSLEAHAEVEVDRVADVPGSALEASVPLSDVTNGLTAKQLTALRLAVREGYYAAPRETDAARLARAMGVARSTYQEHLRKAEARVLETFARVLEAHPGLLAEAPSTAPRARARRAPR